MKKITYLMAAAALAACSGNPGGYTVSGTVEGAADGDTVLLQRPERRQLVPIDTAVVEGGRFTFTGRQDSAINVYITCRSKAVPQGLLMDFFLENGQIDVTLTTGAADAATGTALNDKYQEVRQRVSTYNAQMQALGETYQTDTTLTDEGRQHIVAQYDSLQQKASEIMQQSIEQNSDNLVGVTLLKQVSMNLEPAKLIEIMDKIPAGFDTDAQVAHLRQLAQSLKSTLSGQLFTELTLATPEGKEVRLSDYVGHGKVVLVDFWASWCGPCRREMPSLVEAYKKFAGKNFEIVGISLDEDAEAWKLAIEKLHITWPQMSDLKGWRSVAASTYAVNSIPHTILIDADGRILQRGLHGEELLKAIEEALKK